MHCAAHFQETRPEVLHGLIRAHALATVVMQIDGQLQANHLPLFLRDDGQGGHSLVGHVSRNDPLWRAPEGTEVLCIFQGPQAYISPSWYATKAEHGRVVPTWNYVVVHAHGPLKVHDNPHWLRQQLQDLTAAHEGPREHPWAVSDAPWDFTEKLIGLLVGIEVPIQRLQGKFKLSQNQPEANQQGVVQGLTQASPGCPVAESMVALMRPPSGL